MREVDAILKLNLIFKNKNWRGRIGEDDIFESFSELIKSITPEQRQLIVELTDRYLWISSNEYETILIKLLNSIDNNDLIGISRIVGLPIIRPEDTGKVKSSSSLLYALKSYIHYLKPEMKTKKVTLVEDITNSSVDNLGNSSDMLILIDDYLGSGETLKAAIYSLKATLGDEIFQNLKEKNKIIVVSLVAEQKSVDFLNDNCILYCIEYITQKGISDYYVEPHLSEKMKIMQDLEKMLPNGYEDLFFEFGFNKSEALVTMMRTPDNTFPIFWKNYRKEYNFNPPFYRP